MDGPISSACMGKIDKHTYIRDIEKLVFYVFLTFSSKNVALAVEFEFSDFRKKKRLIFCVGCMILWPALANIHGILVLRWCKNLLDEL